MADALYPSFLDSLWNGLVNIGSDTFKAALLTSAYTYSSAHTQYSSLTGVLASATMTGLTSSSGVLDATDTPVLAVVGIPVAVVIYQYNAGTPGNSRLFCYRDQGVGFSVDENGTVTIIWPNDANVKIFPLGGLA